MGKANYSFSKTVSYGFSEAIAKITEELKKEGFGILSETDAQATLKSKLNVEMKPYVILGACHPALAWQTLQAEEQMGLLLPCNIIVYQNDDNQVVVAAIDPLATMNFLDNPKVDKALQTAAQKLKAAIERM